MPSPSDDRLRSSGEEGTVTAEFAVVLPALLLVTALSVGAVGVAGQGVRLADAAGVAARAAGRGDDGLVDLAVRRLAPGAEVDITRGELVCVHLRRTASIGPLAKGVSLSAESCAPEGGG